MESWVDLTIDLTGEDATTSDIGEDAFTSDMYNRRFLAFYVPTLITSLVSFSGFSYS